MRVLRITGGAGNVRCVVPRELHGERPDAAGRAAHEYARASGVVVTECGAAAEALECGEASEEQRDGVREGNAYGRAGHAVLAYGDVLGRAASAMPEQGDHGFAGFECRDARAAADDDARHVEAWGEGASREVREGPAAGPQAEVGAVHA